MQRCNPFPTIYGEFDAMLQSIGVVGTYIHYNILGYFVDNATF